MNEATGYSSVSSNHSVVPSDPNSNSVANSVSPSSVGGQLQVREIYKNGWLKKYPVVERKLNPFTKQHRPEPQWVVLCVHNDSEAFLEMYESRRGTFTHKPLNIIPLDRCIHISPSLIMQDNHFNFTVTLETVAIKFATASREQMTDWIDTIKNKLTDLGVFQKQENLYSDEPVQPRKPKRSHQLLLPLVSTHSDVDSSPSPSSQSSASAVDTRRLSASRDPASPLPPLPPPRLESSASASQVADDPPRTSDVSNITVIQLDDSQNVFDFNNLSLRSGEAASTPVTPLSAPVSDTSNVYDAVYSSGNQRRTVAQNSGSPTAVRNRRHSDGEAQSAASSATVNSVNQLEQSTASADSERVSSSASTPQNELSSRPLTLKQQQAVRLKREMSHRGGIRISLRKRDCQHGIAFVECFHTVWIAGWKQREHPFLHNTLHIGDNVIRVAGQPVRTLQEINRLIKHQVLHVELIIRRLPLGVVLAIKRDHDGQDLGLIQDGNTAEIKEVVADGLAAQHGLPARAQSCEQNGRSCNWFLTEINNRPLNLFFKDNEVQTRLNAVGKDISILVQPIDLVKALKKQLKSMRNFKEYIVQ